MRTVKFITYKEGDFYVSRCLNAEVSSFGKSTEEAIANLTEALELYLNDKNASFTKLGSIRMALPPF